MGVSSDHVGGSGLHNLAADNSVVGVLLDHQEASGVGLVGLTSDDWGRGNWGMANGGHTVVKVLGCA